jgi:hypothetical protein
LFLNRLEYNEPYFFPEKLPALATREEKEIKFLETADLYNDWSWWDTLQGQKGTWRRSFSFFLSYSFFLSIVWFCVRLDVEWFSVDYVPF